MNIDIIGLAQEAGLHVFGGDVIDALERFAALVAAEAKCQHYIDIHDAVASDNDRLYTLLDRCETEMRYAGWGAPIADNAGRNAVYEAVLRTLHPEDFEK